MCECAQGGNPTHAAPPGEPVEFKCRVVVGTFPGGQPRICPTVVQGGWHGLHRHHLVLHPTAYWQPRPGHP
jgi:hypothetical protein